ncbi:hypothetical protein K435DRAFT_650870 [Dendrothele bispora CBS 962.96]|uniref:Uncharacterized protein n=1 Tax=Dendrothele bispora (strain CBS 962.96) TaxID=1314807 RepID=A0A4S8MM53_DENBC|nr:hypothetical protein K435DRAFT_650870 [Dendrothele bispora CBS 962.96]
MHWANTGSNLKSNEEVNRLVKDVINPLIEEVRQPEFAADPFRGFDASRENQRTNRAAAEPDLSFATGFKKSSVKIQVPSGFEHVPPAEFTVDGLLHTSLVDTIKLAFTEPLSKKFHLSPFEYYHQRPDSEHHERVYGELYTSPAFIQEHDKVQRASLPSDDTSCTRERVVAGLMLWSDSTHLANFGVAKLWPIYVMFGNLSKYIRAMPNSGACHHLAYIPSLPDSFSDFASKFHPKWQSQRSEILTHCRRELMHEVWKLLLDEEFLKAYEYGIVIRCADGVERRIYPRIFTYSADYPEKVLLATIRDKGMCPCPRCMVAKSVLDQLGCDDDSHVRTDNVRPYFKSKVKAARRLIYNGAVPIRGAKVERQLKETSSVPTLNAFMDKLALQFNFNVSQMLVVDLLHEFELGVWKAFFAHLVRILYAQGPSSVAKVAELDRRQVISSLINVNELSIFFRFRQVPAFGHSTIRHFATNASEMKKLAARDFEDLLQVRYPLFN